MAYKKLTPGAYRMVSDRQVRDAKHGDIILITDVQKLSKAGGPQRPALWQIRILVPSGELSDWTTCTARGFWKTFATENARSKDCG